MLHTQLTPTLLCLSALLGAAGVSHAQTPPKEQPAMQASAIPVFAIKGFTVTGDNPLSPSQTDEVLAPYIRPDATLDNLQQGASALEKALGARGYALHRVVLPPQEVGATVTLSVVKFVIGKVEIEGLERFSQANIRASLPELQEGQTPHFGKLAVQTAIANESQGKQVQVGLKESEEADKIDVHIVVKEAKPWNFSASISNTGTAATGTDRLSLVGSHSNLFDRDHQFSGAYTTSAQQRDAVKQLGLNYRVPLYALGGTLGLAYTQSDVAGNFGTFSSTGAGQTAGLNYAQQFEPQGGRRATLTVGLDDKQFDVTNINDVPIPGQVKRASRPLSLGYSVRIESDTALSGYNAEFATNAPGGTGNDLASYQSEDARIVTVHWKVLRAGANILSSFPNGWLWSAKAQLQYSPDALISGEQFGIGGSSSVRGTGERPLSGDSGVFVSAELSTAELAPGLRLLGFVDSGWLRNQSANGTTKPDSDHLASVGLGLRWNAATWSLSAEYGKIITGSVLPLTPGSSTPQAGDQKLHLNLSARL